MIFSRASRHNNKDIFFWHCCINNFFLMIPAYYKKKKERKRLIYLNSFTPKTFNIASLKSLDHGNSPLQSCENFSWSSSCCFIISFFLLIVATVELNVVVLPCIITDANNFCFLFSSYYTKLILQFYVFHRPVFNWLYYWIPPSAFEGEFQFDLLYYWVQFPLP